MSSDDPADVATGASAAPEAVETSERADAPLPSPARSGRAPGIAEAIGWEALFLALSALTSIPALLLEDLLDDPTRFFLATSLAWCGVFLAVKGRMRESWRELFPLKRFSPRLLPGIALASLGILFIAMQVAAWIPYSETWEKLAGKLFEHRFHWATIASLVLLAPVFEELFYRGFILRGFLSRYPRSWAVFASALLFAIAHLNPWQGVLALPMGILTAWLFIETGSVWPCIVSHAIVNGFHLPVLIALELSGDLDQLRAADPSAQDWSPGMLLTGLVFTAVGVWFLAQIFRSGAIERNRHPA